MAKERRTRSAGHLHSAVAGANPLPGFRSHRGDYREWL